MGYSYETATGRLCCDACGNAGAVRRKRCPHDWCQPIALCPACRALPRFRGSAWAAMHADCATSQTAATERAARAAELLDAGAYLRVSALGDREQDRVHVIFRNREGDEIGRYMTREQYRAIPLLTPATPDDYGPSVEAPAEFNYQEVA